MVEAQNDIPMVNAKVQSEPAGLDVRHQDPLLFVEVELVHELLALLARKTLHG